MVDMLLEWKKKSCTRLCVGLGGDPLLGYGVLSTFCVYKIKKIETVEIVYIPEAILEAS